MHVYHQYTVRVPEGREPSPPHCARSTRWDPDVLPRAEPPAQALPSNVDLPETARAAAECLSLPVHPSLSQGDLERIVNAVNALAAAGA